LCDFRAAVILSADHIERRPFRESKLDYRWLIVQNAACGDTAFELKSIEAAT
jgi:hypothetical protein